MTIRILILLAASCATSPRVAAQPTAPHQVQVRVYNTADLQPRVVAAALASAHATLAEASVEVAWEECSATDVPACLAPAPGAYVLRFVRGPLPDPSRLRAGDPVPLGDAYVDTARGAGVLATVYVERVRRLAGMAGADVATVRGDAVAHELGHLLLASAAHATRGLMRPAWAPGELRRRVREDWTFTSQEVSAIQRRRHSAGAAGCS